MIKALYHCHKKSIVHRDLKPENYVFETKADDSGSSPFSDSF
jgi:serine/threonine protein kinase